MSVIQEGKFSQRKEIELLSWWKQVDVTIFACCYKMWVRRALDLPSHINHGPPSMLQICTWGKPNTTPDDSPYFLFVSIYKMRKLFVHKIIIYVGKLLFLLDFLRSGATDQQKNADGKEENKKEVGLHTALKCPPTVCSRPGRWLIIIIWIFLMLLLSVLRCFNVFIWPFTYLCPFVLPAL